MKYEWRKKERIYHYFYVFWMFNGSILIKWAKCLSEGNKSNGKAKMRIYSITKLFINHRFLGNYAHMIYRNVVLHSFWVNFLFVCLLLSKTLFVNDFGSREYFNVRMMCEVDMKILQKTWIVFMYNKNPSMTDTSRIQHWMRSLSLFLLYFLWKYDALLGFEIFFRLFCFEIMIKMKYKPLYVLYLWLMNGLEWNFQFFLDEFYKYLVTFHIHWKIKTKNQLICV